jgi:hypothetical protein
VITHNNILLVLPTAEKKENSDADCDTIQSVEYYSAPLKQRISDPDDDYFRRLSGLDEVVTRCQQSEDELLDHSRMPKEKNSTFGWQGFAALFCESQDEADEILDNTVAAWNDLGQDTSIFKWGSTVEKGDNIHTDGSKCFLDSYIIDSNCLKFIMILHQIECVTELRDLSDKQLRELSAPYFKDKKRGARVLKKYAAPKTTPQKVKNTISD